MSLKRDRSVGDLPSNTDDWIHVDQKKARRSGKNKEKKQQQSLPSSQTIDDAINAVLDGDPQQSCSTAETKGFSSTQTQTDHDHPSTTTQVQLDSLRAELKQLLETVSCLSSKIDHLTSILQTADTNRKIVSDTHNASVGAVAANHPNSETNRAKPKVSNDRQTRSVAQDRDQNPVTAMYIDLNLKHQRSNNIVISGMPPAQSQDLEMKAVIDMLSFEYDWDGELWPGVSIVKCRWLGKPQEGKYQPLLVTLDTREQAEYYIKHAKQLRNSTKPEISQSVFINPDLTPSESRAAYELRLRRRERMHQPGSDHDRQSNKPTLPISRTFYHSRDSAGINIKSSAFPIPTPDVHLSTLSPSRDTNVSKNPRSPASSLCESRLLWRTSSGHDERTASDDVVQAKSTATVINSNGSTSSPTDTAANNTDTASAGRQC